MARKRQNLFKQKFLVFGFFLVFVFLSVTCATKSLVNIKSESGEVKLIEPKVVFNTSDLEVIEGKVFSVRLTSNVPIAAVSGKFQDKDIEFYPIEKSKGREFGALLGVAYGSQAKSEKVVATYKIIDAKPDPEKIYEISTNIEIKNGEFPSEKLAVPPRTIEPNAKDKIRIAKENEVLKQVYARQTKEKLWAGPMKMPVDNIVTSQYGSFRLYNNKKVNAHLGTDLRAAVGVPIVAPLDGYVVLARSLFYTGNTVILDHGYGMFSIYGHQSRLKVKEGTLVRKGTLLGLSGATGRVSGPHLHWGLNLHGVKVDPLALVEFLLVNPSDERKDGHQEQYPDETL